MEFKNILLKDSKIEVVFGYREGDLCHCRFLFNVGSYYEDDKTRGISHLIEHLMFNCCPGLSSLDFNRKMDELGMSINASTSREFTRFYFTGVRDNFIEALRHYFNIISNFTVTEEILAKEVEVVCNEIGVSKDDNWDTLYNNMNAQAFKSHPIKDPILGYEDVLRNLTVEDVQNYYDKFYCIENLKLIIVGDFVEEEIIALDESLSNFRSGEASEIIRVDDKQVVPFVKKIISYKDGLYQSFIDSFVPFKERQTNIFVPHVASNILGCSMSSYLWDEFREKRSLSYIVGAYNGCIDIDNSRLHMYAALNNSEDIDLAESIFENAISYLKNVGEDEFNKGLIMLKSAHLINIQKITELASLWEDYNYFYRGTESFEEYINQLNKITYDDFKLFTDALDVEDMVTGIIYPQEVQR